MPKGIQRLELNRFRGATTSTVLEFDTKKLVVMLFGENGTGKSTIIDAIDLVCNGEAGSIRRPSVRVKKHLPALGASIADVHINLKCDNVTWNARHDGENVQLDQTTPPPTAHILRRSQLLRLIESTPGERYKEIRGFIDVGGVEDCEAALNDAVSQAQKRSDQATQSLFEANETLESLWKSETTDAITGQSLSSQTHLEWAATKANANLSELKSRSKTLSRQLQALNDLKLALEQVAVASGPVASTQQVYEVAQQRLANVIESSDETLVGVLNEASHWLQRHADANSCPVCEQPVEPEHLRSELQSRLERLDEIRRAGAEVKRTRSHLDSMRSSLSSSQARLKKAALALAPLLPEASLSEAALPLEETSTSPAWQPILNREAPLRREYEEVQRDLNQFNAIVQLHERRVASAEVAAEALAQANRLKAALEVVRTQRRTFTQSILAFISGECNRLYQQIHPGEDVGDLDFQIDETRRASLGQKASFRGHDGIVPQAYFSESHLDTLGFCLFLALAKHQSGKDAIIVLDDVFTSVDAQHLTRIFELLRQEGNYFRQIFITTHYRNWREQNRYLHGQEDIVELVELGRWSLGKGVRPAKTAYTMDELRALLDADPFNRQQIASLSGILLEAVFDHIASLYRLSLPRNPEGTYTLGDLGSAVLSKAKKFEIDIAPTDDKGVRTVTSTTCLKDQVDDLMKITFIRNQVGGHFNPGGAEIPDNDVAAFGEKTLLFLQTVVCLSCGNPPKKAEAGYFKCTCGEKRLKPLSV